MTKKALFSRLPQIESFMTRQKDLDDYIGWNLPFMPLYRLLWATLVGRQMFRQASRISTVGALLVVVSLLLASSIQAQTFTAIHSFTGSDGQYPDGQLVVAGTQLYGTAQSGGKATGQSAVGGGTVFTMNTSGAGFKVLHNFNVITEGAGPTGLVLSGNTLYGIISSGIHNSGAVFSINTDGTGFKILHSFAGGTSDGARPVGTLVLSNGILYGTTSEGGNSTTYGGAGTVFSIGTNGSNYKILHFFTYDFDTETGDGFEPEAPLLLSGSTLYGTTVYSTFSLDVDGENFKVLSTSGGSADLIFYNGIFFGTTYNTIFSMDTDGSNLNELYEFQGGQLGNDCVGGLVSLGSVLYGGTAGTGNGDDSVIFSLNPDGTGYKVLYNLGGSAGGGISASLTLSSGTLYGVNETGGSGSLGSVFSLQLTSPPPTGFLEVSLEPSGAVAAGALWQVDGGTWAKSGVTVGNLPVGNHVVSFAGVRGWLTPSNQTVVVNNNSTTKVTETYLAGGSIQVTLSPAMAIAEGAKWQVDSGALQNSGATVSNLAVGLHTLSFTGLDYWAAPSNVTVTIKANSVEKATETYAFKASGTYNGLFAEEDPDVATSGMLSDLVVKPTGLYSGKLLIAGGTYSFTGDVNSSGMATNIIARTTKQGGPIDLAMWVNWTNTPFTIGGTVSGATGSAWTANLTMELATSGMGSAEYTALLLPAGTPPGYGYMVLTNHLGTVALTGAMADGTPYSQSVPWSGNGDLPIYGNFYENSGLLQGWIHLQSGAPTGSLVWIKEASHFNAQYVNGFTNLTVSLVGSTWTNPPAKTAAIELQKGQLNITGGGLLSPLQFNVGVSNNNMLIKLTGSATNTLTGTITPKTGLFTLDFGNGDGKAITQATGVILQNTTNAGGYFLGKTNTGAFYLQP
jgi:hypothetical protein